ncbi:MAG: hypothetical protein HYY01_00945 [Chloroflexi bacterium]|nr:hypothetical protein [Chloroflexota bacterium]
MRGKNMRILGKSVPAAVVAMALILSTAGAAVGVVLAGRVTGSIGATVGQALVVRLNAGTSVTGAPRSLVTVEDDGTAFAASAELFTGDQFNVNLALANLSGQELTGELTLVAPEGITLAVTEAGDVLANAVRTGPFNWKFRMNASDNATTDLVITVALADDMPPGFYYVDGTIKQVSK